MSDHYLQLISTDPQFQPAPEAAEQARKLFETFTPQADSVAARFAESIEFFHPGSNGLEIHCPACGADASDWWSDAMDTAWKSHFDNITVTAHCCGASVSLNDLRYDWPAGFGRFMLEARNPNVPDLQASQVAQLQTTLGCTLRTIWVHI
jgi:hypothetical protein